MNIAFTPFNTLTEVLHSRAERGPQEMAFIIDGKSYSCIWLWEKSCCFASRLISENVDRNDRVLVLVPNSAAFFIAFYGCILSGAVAVPIFPKSGTGRCSQIMHLSGSRHIILPSNTATGRKHDYEEWSALYDVRIHWVDESLPLHSISDFPHIVSDDIAFIQYTSGSTDFPKGVPVTHRMLLSNIMQMAEAMKINARDVFVSWLPVYHDMGLILNTMVPLYTGAGLVLLAEGLHKVHTWLKTIEHYKGTFISAPDIAYRLCVKSIRNPADYDLSSLRVALNASEPVHFNTYWTFEKVYNLKNIMVSGYGLAEATVAVTMHPPGVPPKKDRDGYVSSGKPLKGIDIRIDGEETESDEKKTGEILVKSTAMMQGYYNKKKGHDPIDENGYLHTGDIGYLDAEGYLFVLARKKNIIKQAGHTLYPDDVEQAIEAMEDVRRVAVIGIENAKEVGESLYVFAESRWHECPSMEKCHELAVDIVQRIFDHFGIKPGRVYIVQPKTLPLTPNGKLQHSILKNIYLNNFEQIVNSILYPQQKAV